MDALWLLAGLVGLWAGTEAALRGAVAVADRLGVSEFLIGVAILSVGSDLPELAIAIDAALKNLDGRDFSDLVVGSALGSGLGQIGFVLGVAGLLAQLTLPRETMYRHGGVLLGSLVVLGVFGGDGAVTRLEGFVLVALYLGYLGMLFASQRNQNGGGEGRQRFRLLPAILYLVVGLGVVVASAELTVTSASTLALNLGIEESFVAIIIIGLGSSLPELSISIAAVMKGNTRLSVGNLVGSNIFDTLVPVGAAALIATLRFDRPMLTFELPFLFAVTAIVLALFAGPRGVRKPEAAVVLGAYLVYVSIKLLTASA